MHMHSNTRMTDEKPGKTPVITAEDIYIYVHLEEWGQSEKKAGLLPKDKRDFLDNDMLNLNPESAVVKYLDECDAVKKRLRHGQFGQRAQPRNPGTAYERQAIIDFARKEVEKGRLSEAAAIEVLAEGGETISWMDSPTDRLLLEEPMVPIPGDAIFKRHMLAKMSPVLADVMEEGNQMMIKKLGEISAELATELAESLVNLRQEILRQTKKGHGRGPTD
jgi:hypothetical protein